MTATETSQKRLPRSISPDPLVEAIMEIRFDPAPPPDAVFGLVYSAVREQYPSVEKLPIVQLPDELREQDPNLMFRPHYRLTQAPLTLQIGPRVVSLTVNPYPGWTSFSTHIRGLLGQLVAQDLFRSFRRVALRYINVLEENVFKSSNLSVSLSERSLADENTFLRTQLRSGDVTTTLQVANSASIGEPPNTRTGSAIDLDAFISDPKVGNRDVDALLALLTSDHQELKRIFFSVVSNDFLAARNPQYD